MSHFIIPNRPFAVDLITGLMLPDGIFVTLLGRQNLTVQLKNQGASASGFASVNIESVSHPGIQVFANTHTIGALASQAVTTVAWTIDVTNCPAGVHYVSIIVDEGGTKHRVIKKFFVLGLMHDPAKGFVADLPEGRMIAKFGALVKPRKSCCAGHKPVEPDREPAREDGQQDCCCGTQKRSSKQTKPDFNLADLIRRFRGHDPDFVLCPPGYLIKTAEYSWEPAPYYQGQYGDLPFTDPAWHKVVLAVIAFLLLVGAAIAEALDGTGSVTPTVEYPPTSSGPVEDCCGIEAEGGGTSYIAAGLLAAAAAVATVAGLSDERDAFRVGQDKTPPGDDETTLLETFFTEFSYPESVALGRPFVVEADWKYRRATDARSYDHAQRDAYKNIHVATAYEVSAPEVAVRANRDQPWIITARFRDADGELFKGEQLLVQCFLVGPNGQWHKAVLQDDGIWPDEAASNGTYSAYVNFRRFKAEPGLWTYYVIAQDVNHAQPDMQPEEAAQIIGGMVLTHQLTLSFTEDECPIIPDGHVMVV